MAEIRTSDVDDLLSVLAALDDPDAIFALLEDLFTVREIRETSQRLGVARLLAAGEVLCGHRGGDRRLGHDYRPGFQMPQLRRRRLRASAQNSGCAPVAAVRRRALGKGDPTRAVRR